MAWLHGSSNRPPAGQALGAGSAIHQGMPPQHPRGAGRIISLFF